MPETKKDTLPLDPEPRWPVVLALLAVGGLNAVMPDELSPGPYWLLLVVVSLLAILVILAHRTGRHDLNQILSHILLGVVTLSLIVSLALLVRGLLTKSESPQMLLRGASALWIANILVFASWYWRLDAGGPNQRDLREAHTEGAFLFPQMTMKGKDAKAWSPEFVDYLFLAFNTSTAFSPTDVPVLSRWAKIMMIVQATISLMTVALIAARAVNIL